MSFTLDRVVPWGRSLSEYTAMFNLSETDLRAKRILGCADGPASFNAELTQRGGCVLSIDPLYEFSAAQIKERIDKTYGNVMSQLRQNLDAYVWTAFHTSAEDVGEARQTAMRNFLKDYEAGRDEGRYVAAALPFLPFDNLSFDLVLCSHCLFLYSTQLSLDFHVQSVEELCRMAREVRIFPLLTLDGSPSPHLQPVLRALENLGYQTTIEEVPYEFQRGGNQMLRVRC